MWGLSWTMRGQKHRRFFMSQRAMHDWISYLKRHLDVRDIVILPNALNTQEVRVS